MKNIKTIKKFFLVIELFLTLAALSFFVITAFFSKNPIFEKLTDNCILSALALDIFSQILINHFSRQKTLKVRNTSAEICDLFEELLDKYNITIPSDDRTGEESEARIYGKPYSDLEDSVTEILSELCNDIKENPYVNINTEEY